MGDVSYRPLIEDMTWSYSRLKCFETCAYKWYMSYILEEDEAPMFYASYGSFVHELIARFYTGELTKEELLPEFLQGFCFRVQGKRPSREIEKKYLDQGAFYFENFEPFPLSPLQIEKQIEIDLDGIKFTGFIDFLGTDGDGNHIIVDHKSADLKPRSKRKKPTKDDEKLDEMLTQLYLYSAWVKETYGTYPKELWFNCFRTGNVIREPFDPDACEKTLRWARKLASEIAGEEDFRPYVDFFQCKYLCGFQNDCCYWQVR